MRMNVPSSKTYRYIFAGGGMSALSLVYFLSQSKRAKEPMLIIDLSSKSENDKTWCYWSDRPEEFDDLAQKSWKNLWFHGPHGKSIALDIAPFQYHKIRSIDWYTYIKKQLSQFPNIEFLQAEVLQIIPEEKDTKVQSSMGDFYATDKVFDSFTAYPCEINNPKHIKQHFLGWEIESHFPIFKSDAVHLFDFRVAQGKECEFMYILPTSSKKALFEYTFFSAHVREASFYRDKIKSYLQAFYGLGEEDYQIKEEEKGIIPMCLDQRARQRISEKIIRIGTSGGFVKASTGYSFLRTQRINQALVKELEKDHPQGLILPQHIFKTWLDKVFLQVLLEQSMAGSEVFEALFQKNKGSKMLRFLDEKTSFWEDLSLMASVPILPFIRAVYHLIISSK
ncbi:lycopene cyclase family protein [Aquirufa salirivi]|uniref:Lycopene cyclase family protein n=1 Tax=Aquirufa salirivi TaxID=3104729 RepID=A0ABW8RYW4_9BACT